MVTVYCLDISKVNREEEAWLYANASPERRARAKIFRKREGALRCLAGEALLRCALGTEDYTLERHKAGKPRVRGREDFHFNISHAGSWVVLAFGNTPVGVDVEVSRERFPIRRFSARFFAPEEQDFVRTDAGRFLQVWTGKESYLKYLGGGIDRKLSSFSVFSLPAGIRLHWQELTEECCLCLCTGEVDYHLEMRDIRSLQSEGGCDMMTETKKET